MTTYSSRIVLAISIIVLVVIAGSGHSGAQPTSITVTYPDASVSVGETGSSAVGSLGDGMERSSQQNGNGTPTDSSDYSIDVGFVEVPLGEAISKIVTYVIDQLQAGISSLVDSFSAYILGVPAPGEATDPSSWVSADGVWKAVFAIYGIMSALAIAFLTPSFMVATDTAQKRERHARFAELGKATFFIILGIPITAFFLHFGNALVMTVSPGGTEFFMNSNSLANLGIGVIFGSLLIAIKSTTILLALGFAVVIYLLTLLSVSLWPLFWATRVQPEETVTSFGIVGLSMLPQLILLKFLQGSILRFLYYLPIDTLGNAVFKLVATTIGIGITFIGLPYIFLTKLLPGATMIIDRGADSTTHKSGETTGTTGSSGQYTSHTGGGQVVQSAGPRSTGPSTQARPLPTTTGTSPGPKPDRPAIASQGDTTAQSDTATEEDQDESHTAGPQSKGPRKA